jgi:hypothetical protein
MPARRGAGAAKATETGLISPTSISKVLMPFAFEDIALRSQVADNSADFMSRKSRIDRDREVVQPELGFEISGANILVTCIRHGLRVCVQIKPFRQSILWGHSQPLPLSVGNTSLRKWRLNSIRNKCHRRIASGVH